MKGVVTVAEANQEKPGFLQSLLILACVGGCICLMLRACTSETSAEKAQRELWERAVVTLPGSAWNKSSVEAFFGPGTYTNRTNNQEGWIYFPRMHATVVTDKGTMRIKRVVYGNP